MAEAYLKSLSCIFHTTFAFVVATGFLTAADTAGKNSATTSETVSLDKTRKLAERFLAALERNPGEEVLAEKLFNLFQTKPFALAELLQEPVDSPGRRGVRLYLLGQLQLRQSEPSKALASFKLSADLLTENVVPLVAMAKAARTIGDSQLEKDALTRLLTVIRLGSRSIGHDVASLALRLAQLHLQTQADSDEIIQALSTVPDAAWADPGLIEKVRRTLIAFGKKELLREFLTNRIAHMDGRVEVREATLALEEALLREYATPDNADCFLAASDRLLRRANPGSTLSNRLVATTIEAAFSGGLSQKLFEHWKRLSEADPENPAAALRLAQLARRLPNREAEQIEYESLMRYITIHPTDRDANIKAAELEVALGNAHKASERLLLLQKIRPADISVTFELARALLAADQENAAVAEIERLLNSRPDDTSLQRRALLFFRENLLRAPAERLLQLMAANGTPSFSNSAGQALVELADFLIQQGRHAEAPPLLARLIPSNASAAEQTAASMRVADLLLERQLPVAARNQLQVALSKDADNPEIRLKLSQIEIAFGNIGRARLELIAASEAALRLPPSPRRRDLLDEADKKLFALLARHGGQSGTEDGWVKINLPGLGEVPLRPAPSGLRALPSEIHRIAEDFNRRATEKNDPWLWRRVGLWLTLLNDPARAAAAYQKAANVADDRSLRIELTNAAVSSLMESGNHEAAIELLSRFIENEAEAPNSTELHPLRLQLAKALGAAHRVGEAAEVIEQALLVGVPPDSALPVLANIQQAEGYHADALATIRRLLPLSRPGSQQRLGIIRNLLSPSEQLGQAAETAKLLFEELLQPGDFNLRKEIFDELVGFTTRNRLSHWLEDKLRSAVASSPEDPFLAEALPSLQKTSAHTTQETGQPENIFSDRPFAPPPARASDPAPALEAATLAWRQEDSASAGAREAGLRLARLQEAVLDFDAAVQTLERLSRLFPRNTDIRFELARLFRQLGDTESEIKAVLAALQLEPSHFGFLERAAHLAMAHGDRASAINFYQNLIKHWIARVQKHSDQPTPAPVLSPSELVWPPLPQSLLSRLPAFAIAGEQRAFPSQIALSRTLRELQRQPASLRGDRETYLNSIRELTALLTEKLTDSRAELDDLLTRLAQTNDVAAYWNALWAAGRAADALHLLETRCRFESDPPHLRFAFLRAALHAKAYNQIAEWLSGSGRGDAARGYIRVALVMEADERGSVSNELIDTLLSTDDFPPTFIGQIADLLGRLSLPEAALYVLSKLKTDTFIRLTSPPVEDVARWLVALGRSREAMALLDMALPATPLRSGSDPALTLLRLRWLLTPNTERHVFERPEFLGSPTDPLRALFLECLKSEASDREQTAVQIAALTQRIDPEAILDLGMTMRGLGMRRSARIIFDVALRNPGVLTADNPTTVIFMDQIRLYARAWAMEEDGGDLPNKMQPLSFEPVAFLHKLADALESNKKPAAAAVIYGEIVQALDDSTERSVFLRSQMTMLRNAGRLSEAAAILRPMIERLGASKRQKSPGLADNNTDRGFLLEQTSALTSEFSAANAPEQAFELLNIAERALPGEPALAKARFDLLSSLGRFREAFEIIAGLARQQQNSAEYYDLAAQTALNSGTPEKGIELIEKAWALPPAQRRSRLLNLTLAAGNLDRASSLGISLLSDDPGNTLAPLIHQLVLSNHPEEAAYVVLLAEKNGCDVASLFNLKSALAIAITERPAPTKRLVKYLVNSLKEAAEPLGGRALSLEFSTLIEMLFRLPADGEASPVVENRLLLLTCEDLAQLPIERAVEIALRTGRSPLAEKIVDHIITTRRANEQTLFLVASSLLAHDRLADALRISKHFSSRFPLQASALLMEALSESLLTGTPPGPSFHRALDLGAFEPEVFGKAAFLMVDLRKNNEALKLFNRWERLTPEINPTMLTALSKLRIVEAANADRAAEVARTYLATAQSLPDLSPLAIFHEKFAPSSSAKELTAKLGIDPFLVNSLALAIFQNLTDRDPTRAVSFLEQHPALFHIPNRPINHFTTLANLPQTTQKMLELLTRAADEDSALPLRQLLDTHRQVPSAATPIHP